MAINFPNTPNIGDEFTGGGFTWTWSGTSWEKVAQASNDATTGFDLVVGTSGNNTYFLDVPQAPGPYTITSENSDNSFDVYLISQNNENVGYSNINKILASAEFDKVVVFGSEASDVLRFEYKQSSEPTSSGTLTSGVSPYITSASTSSLPSENDSVVILGGNFAEDVSVFFIGQDQIEREAKSVIFNTTNEMIVTRPDIFSLDYEPYSLKVLRPGVPEPSLGINILSNYFDAGSPLTWITTSLADSFINTPYSQTLQATDPDGIGITYSISSGSLPVGLSLDTSSGIISGTPTSAGQNPIEFVATDSGNNSVTQSLDINFSIGAANILLVNGGEVTSSYLVTRRLYDGFTSCNYQQGNAWVGGKAGSYGTFNKNIVEGQPYQVLVGSAGSGASSFAGIDTTSPELSLGTQYSNGSNATATSSCWDGSNGYNNSWTVPGGGAGSAGNGQNATTSKAGNSGAALALSSFNNIIIGRGGAGSSTSGWFTNGSLSTPASLYGGGSTQGSGAQPGVVTIKVAESVPSPTSGLFTESVSGGFKFITCTSSTTLIWG